MKLYIGCYTTRLEGKGLAQLELDGDRLRLSGIYRDIEDPLYCALSDDRKRLYAVGVGSDGEGYCVAYDVSGVVPILISKGKLGAPDCCHVELSPDERFAYAACYASGRVSVLPIQDGIKDTIQVIQLEGGSHVNPQRQDKAHAHQITLMPKNDRIAHVVDLGSDEIVSYRRDSVTGKLAEIGRTHVSPGSGPRHITYHPNGCYAYLAYELGNLVSMMEWKGDHWDILQTLSTLPEDEHMESYAGAIRFDEEAGKVLVTNRGHNSIAVFDVMNDAYLSLDRFIPCGGDFPRDLWLLKDRRMLTANQLSGTVVLLDVRGKKLSEARINAAVSVCG